MRTTRQPATNLPALIRSRMARDGLHQCDAAARIGVSAATLSRVLRGQSFDLATFVAAIRWLGVSADEALNPPPTVESSWANARTTYCGPGSDTRTRHATGAPPAPSTSSPPSGTTATGSPSPTRTT